MTKIRHACIEGKFQSYKLIEYVVYPVRPWMYCPFKGGKTTLSGKEAKLEFHTIFDEDVRREDVQDFEMQMDVGNETT